jgi:hypothetical protein
MAAGCLALVVVQACPGGSPNRDTAAAAVNTGNRDESSGAIAEFLDSYFSSWSDANLEVYAAHFHPDATIKFIDDGEVELSLGLTGFIDMQAQVIADAESPMREKMTSCEVRERDGVAWVGADWELVQGQNTTTGVDHFLLVQDETGAWKIISLVYYIHDEQ